MRTFLSVAVLALTAGVLNAATIHVPAGQPTIQAGIDAAVSGDTVLVAPGTYSENVDFLGKSVVLRSSDGAGVTTLQPSVIGVTVVQMDSGEGPGTQFSGFTVVGGSGPDVISIENNSEPTICDNVFLGYDGGDEVIRCNNSDPLIVRNLFYDNTLCIGITPTGTARIINNTFDGNNRGFFTNGLGIVLNNIVTNCSNSGITQGSGVFEQLDYNNVWNNNPDYAGNLTPGQHDISVDPVYDDPVNHDYRLQGTSPCINAGDPDPQYNDPDGTRNDMGAFYFDQMPPQVVSTSPTQNALNVPVDANITVTFDSDMDPATINDSTFLVHSSLGGREMGTVNYNGPTRTLSFSISEDFKPGELVSVTVTDDIRSTTGQQLSFSYVWYFTTAVSVGTGLYQDALTYGVANRPHGLTTGDFNGDGHPDIAAANSTVDSVSVLLNTGSGSFLPYTSYGVGHGPLSVVAADFDGDGYLDLACASNPISVLLNNCDGTFGPEFSLSGSGARLAVGDLNGDGTVDIVAAADANAQVFLNNGNAVFGEPVSYSVGGSTNSVCLADFDRDGDVDLACSNVSSGHVSVLMNGGTGTFSDRIDYPVEPNPHRIISVDLNNDEAMDLVVVSDGPDTVSVLMNNGNGTFAEHSVYPSGGGHYSICWADVDADSDLDVVVANAGFDLVSILLGDQSVSLIMDTAYSVGDWPRTVVAADFDGNNSLDLATGNYLSNNVSILLNTDNTVHYVEGVHVDGYDPATNVVDHTPLIEWSYTDPLERRAQTQFEIAVGTDNDWEYAEMWNPAPFQTADTFVTYAGIELLDGETYYLRLRVHNGVFWSDWYETSFRMNSLPSVPVPLHPINDEQTDNQPWLWVQNSTDAEGDALTYDFFCCVDTTYGEPDPVYEYDVAEGADSTGWQVTEPLEENKRYGWIVRAYDGYEYSDWTASYEYMFFVNGTPEPPTAPQAQYPPDTSGLPVFDMLTYFYWSPSNDPDPLDTVHYKLEIAVDSNFTYVNTIDSLMSTPYTLTDSLAFSTHYWWRVTAFDNTGMSTMSPNTPDFWTWTLGDLDHSHAVDISDLVMLVDYMFNSGPAPYRLFLADIDGSCSIDISDLVYLVDYMFTGGPAPLVGCEPE